MWWRACADDTARHALSGIAGCQGGLVWRWVAVDLLVALRRDVGEVVRLLVNDDGGLGLARQVLLGKRVSRRHQQSRAVLANLQRRQVTAGGVAAVSGHLQMSTGRIEVAGRAASRRNRVGLALADRVDV